MTLYALALQCLISLESNNSIEVSLFDFRTIFRTIYLLIMENFYGKKIHYTRNQIIKLFLLEKKQKM